MGEYAEMMLDGTMCQVCGDFMGSAGDGFPRTCAGCRSRPELYPKKAAPKVKCPICEKRVKSGGLADHQRDAHGITSNVARHEGGK